MANYLYSGDAKIEYFPKTASQAIAEGAFMASGGSGEVTVAVNTTARIFGLSQRVVAATDADYADETKIPLIIPTDDTVFKCLVTGTLTTEMVGLQYDLSDAYTVNVAANTYKVVTCVEFISATQGLFKVSRSFLNAQA